MTDMIIKKEDGAELEWLRGYMEEKKLSVAQLARELKYSETVTRRVLNGNYSADMEAFLGQVRDLRATVTARSITGEEVGFIPTQVAHEVMMAAQAARVDRRVIIVRGVSQIGKTTALRQFAAENAASTIMVRMPTNPSSFKLGGRLCAAAGVNTPTSDEDAMTQLCKRLNQNSLLIVDEFHQALYSGVRGVRGAVEWLRELVDEVGCGLLISMTQLPDVDLSSNRIKGMLVQFNQRGQTVRLAEMPSKKDVRMIAGHYGLTGEPGKDIWAVISKLGRENAFGKLIYRFKLAARSAALSGEKLTWDYFVAEHLRLNELEQ